MKFVSEYIYELLHKENCVIVPNLGGFLVKNVSSKFASNGKHLLPPSSFLTFSTDLKQNNVLLRNTILSQEQCSVVEANQKIEDFVNTVLQSLVDTKSYYIKHVGKIFINENGKVSFKPYAHTNFNPESFGLQIIPVERINRVANDKARAKQLIKKRPYRFTAAAASLAIILFASFFFINKQAGENTFSLNFWESLFHLNEESAYKPSTTKSSGDQINLNKEFVEKQPVLAEDKLDDPFADNTQEEDPFQENNSAQIQTAVEETGPPEMAPSSVKPDFHVVIGMFAEQNNALKIKQQAENLGYRPIIKKGRKYYRVLIPFSKSQATMREAQQEVSKTVIEGAWIWELR